MFVFAHFVNVRDTLDAHIVGGKAVGGTALRVLPTGIVSCSKHEYTFRRVALKLPFRCLRGGISQAGEHTLTAYVADVCNSVCMV